jgi:ADP-heptose:LPS heptosyltransferase
MPRALFKSVNLIGDGLYIQPSLAAWMKEHPDWEVDLLTLDDHATCLYKGMGLPFKIIFDKVDVYDFEFNFDVNKAFSLGDTEKMHIVDAYAKMLGVTLESRIPYYKPPEGPSEDGLILLSMFSRSCASREGKPPNKMLGWLHWLQIVALLRQYGPIAVLGGPEDRALLPITEDEYYTGLPLELVGRLMRDAKLLVSIDNGMVHMAATQGTPTIEFYPSCLGKHWIIPTLPKNKIFPVHMDPANLTVIDAVMAVREGLKRVWED